MLRSPLRCHSNYGKSEDLNRYLRTDSLDTNEFENENLLSFAFSNVTPIIIKSITTFGINFALENSLKQPSFNFSPAAAAPKGYSVGRGPHTKVLVPPAWLSGVTTRGGYLKVRGSVE